MAANVTIHHSAFADRRIAYLGELAGYSTMEALGRLAALWSRCTELQTDRPGTFEIRACIGPRGELLLVECGLGEDCGGDVRVRGCAGRTEWYGEIGPGAPRQTAGGKARAANAKRDERGRLLPSSNRAAPTCDAGVAGDVLEAAGPATLQQPSNHPASESGSDSEKDRNHTPRAIVRSTRWERHKAWWTCMLEAHDRLRAKGIKPNSPDLAKHPNEQSLSACERFLREAGYDEAGIDAKMRHVVLVYEAEAERLQHLDFFKPALIWDTTRPDRFPRKVDTSLEEAARDSRTARGQRAGPRRAGELIGPAKPRTDHPVGDRLIPINEL